MSLLLRVPIDESGEYFEVEADHRDVPGGVELVSGRCDIHDTAG